MTDSVTSNGLTEFIAELGGKHFRYRRGYKNVIGQGVKLNQQGVRTELMMETRSGSQSSQRFPDSKAFLIVCLLARLDRVPCPAENGNGAKNAGSLRTCLKWPLTCV